ncbi:MAG: glycerophosphodiester phosphodiesterase, partial [Planctomycetaceae bacterium]|nr:glycerophosphodiester phosphodiesterase [Planctomycetaceae bacterium]
MQFRALAALSLSLLPQLSFGQQGFQFHQPVEPPRAVQIVAPRGMRMLAPENSVAAVRECAVDFIEWAAVDVRRTKDGRHVVLHDQALEPDGSAQVSELTLEQVRLLPIGERFAPRFHEVHPVTLAELFAAVGDDVNLVLSCDGVDAAA